MNLPGALNGKHELIRDLIENQKMTHASVAAEMGVNRCSIARLCKRLGLKTQRTGPRSGEGHPNWSGGRKKVGRYWYLWSADHPHRTKQNYVAEHRLVMEGILGRYLSPEEAVHHIDGNPQNNHPDNLMVFRTNADHLRFDLQGKIPNWTPDGQARIAAGVRKSSANRRRTKSSDDRPPLPTDHPPSSAGSSDAPQASEMGRMPTL